MLFSKVEPRVSELAQSACVVRGMQGVWAVVHAQLLQRGVLQLLYYSRNMA